ncbi:hypothetical protein [Larkinella soli]|uniref:hypothetical protein n=1 Tax=Larkinella soli TaxID=1770527 RepID=UPI000FFB0A2A|nr:hypothetical protein [Larkinella soli]
MRRSLFYSFILNLILVGFTVAQSSAVRSRLKKITYPDGSIRQFYYDTEGKLIKEDLSRKSTPFGQIRQSYGTGGRLTSYSLRYLHPEAPWNYGYAETFVYGTDGRLARKERYVLRQGSSPEIPAKALFYTDSLLYNPAGQITGRRRYSYGVRSGLISATPVSMTTSEYRYDGQGNLAEETSTTVALQAGNASNTIIRKISYEYDDKPNPYRMANYPVFDQNGWSKNNCVRMTTTNVEAGTTAKPLVSAYRYVYDNNLPVRKVEAGNETISEEYEYETY